MPITRPRKSVSEREVSLDAARLAQGVSRQPAHQRFPGQVEEAQNVTLDIAAGIRKRPGTHFDRKISVISGSLVKGGNYRLHPIVRNETERYLVLYGDTEVRVFDLINSDEATITVVGTASAYLDLNTADADDMRLLTVEDTTLILNTTVPVVTRRSEAFTVTAEWRDYGVLIAQTPAEGTYHRAVGDQAGGEEAGYWKYSVGSVTFPTAVFPELTGVNATPQGLYDDLSSGAKQVQGFIVRFQRLPLTIAGGSFVNATKVLTKAAAFTNYVFASGDAIKITGGTGVTTGWYRVANRVSANAITLEKDIGGANPADVTASSIGLQCEVDYGSDNPAATDMHGVAANWTAAFQRAGASDALVSWRVTRAGYGSMTITGPYRGSNATIIDLEAAPATFNVDAGALATDPFYRTGVVITAGTGSAGAGTTVPDTLPVADRWTRYAAPDDPKAAIDERTMPIKLYRTALGPSAKFSLERITWNSRLSGDQESNPPPTLLRKATLQGYITANSLANPTVITSVAHGLGSGQAISIIGSNSTPTIDGNRVVTVLSADTFSVPVNVSGAGTAGSWFYGAKPLSDIAVTRGRFFMGGSGSVVASQANDLYNLFIDDYRTLVDSDPIDVPVGTGGTGVVDWLTEFRETLAIFTRNRQFELSTPEALTPATAAVQPTTAIEGEEPQAGIKPKPSTHDLMFVGPTTRSAALLAYSFDDILSTQSADDVSQHVPDYLPSAIRTMVTAPNEGLTFILEENASELLVYRTVRKGNQTQQSAWCRWVFDSVYRIVDIAVVGKDLWLLVEQAPAVTIATGVNSVVTFVGHGFSNGNTIRLIDSTTEPSIDGEWVIQNVTADTFEIIGGNVTTAGSARCARGVYIFEHVTLTREQTIPAVGSVAAWPYAVHLDRQLYLTGVYNGGTGKTTWTVPAGFFGDGSTLNRVVLGPKFGAAAGTVLTITEYGATTLVVTGDYSAGPCCLGRYYEMEVTLSQPFMRDDGGNADLKGSFLHRELVAIYELSGDFSIQAEFSGGGAPDPSETEYTPLPTAQIGTRGELHAWIGGPVENIEIVIFSDSPRPVSIGAVQHIGDYSPV